MDTSAQPNNRLVAFKGRTMGKLDAKKRNALPSKEFAGPDRSYPIENGNHARDALARVSEFGSPKLKAEVRSNVAKKFPGMAVNRLKKAGKISDKQAAKLGC